MASIEKTVFISYRRKDSYEALAVYQHLTSQHYDVFLDYTSIPSGDFEQIIVSNIKARAHFVLILTPTALDRCSEPGDWLRREIEIAIDEKRNIIPLFFDNFSFSAPGVAEKLTGKMGVIRRYNGLDVPPGYFTEAMERLCEKYLSVPLDAVIHPVPTEVRRVVREERVAADQALLEKREDIDKLVKPAREKSESLEQVDVRVTPAQLSAVAGGRVSATISLVSQSADVDHFTLSLTGIPSDWIASLPVTVHLMPGERKEVELILHVLRSPQSQAGRRALTLKVASQNDPSQFVEVKLTLTIAAYSQFKAELQPQHLRARQTGHLTISNQGNTKESFSVQFTDTSGELSFEPPRPQLQVAPGATTLLLFHPKESQRNWVGGEKIYPFTAQVSLPNGESQTLSADFASRGLLSGWALPTAFILCLIIAGTAAVLSFIFRSSTLRIIKNGDGTVTSSPAGIDCGFNCDSNFDNDTMVTLSAAPISPSTFGGWSGGGCLGTSLTCNIRMSEDRTVNATFNLSGNQTLVVNIVGTGSGTVTSSPAGIDNCGDATCSYSFAENTTVTLTANPISPSIFGGWSGADCSGTGICKVKMSAVQSVIATFNAPGNQTLLVNKTGTGSGTITSSPMGIDCGLACSFDFADNTLVTLTASPITPSTFDGWSGGGCTGTSLTCTITMNAAQTVTAEFDSHDNQTLTVMVINNSTGTVTSLPVGINCSITCSADFPFNAQVTLTANPTSSSTFGGWSGGGCSGTGTCNVILSAAQTVTATFNGPRNQTLTTNLTLNAIPSTLTVGQTGISFSGQVFANPAVPNGQIVQLQVRSAGCGADSFSSVTNTTTTSGNGSFSSSFTAPSSAGTYGFQANFPQTGIIGGNTWNQSKSTCQTVTVNPSPQNQTITVTAHAPMNKEYNTTFTVTAVATSNLPVAITAAGACTGTGSGSASINMSSGTGICTVQYKQPGNSSYNAALDVTESTNAQKANQTITVTTHAPAAADNNTSFAVAAISDSGLAVEITASDDCSGSGFSSATISIFLRFDGSCFVYYQQRGNSNYNPATEVNEITQVRLPP